MTKNKSTAFRQLADQERLQAALVANQTDRRHVVDLDAASDIGADTSFVKSPSELSAAAERSAENRSAAKNGAMLGSSLAFTASVGVLVSLFIVPNAVHDTGTGILGIGEALASVSLVLAGLGMDSYLRKEVSVRKDHADRLFASVLFVRLILSVVLTVGAIGFFVLRHADVKGNSPAADKAFGTTLLVVGLFCVAQFFQQTSESYAAMLQAVGQVRQQSTLTIGTKVLWAVMIVLGLLLHVGVWIVPFALMITEMAKTVVLGKSAQQVFSIDWTLRLKETWPMIKASSPFLVTAISVKVITWMDVAMVGLITNDNKETGYYNIALRISALALLLAPLIQWVVIPMAARAADRSRADFAQLVKRSFQWVLCAGVPMSLLLGLNADIVIRTFLKGYLPAIPALRILSAVIALSYVSMLGATLLIADGRSWRVVRITFVTISIDIGLNLYTIRHGWMWWGQGTGALKAGGAGIGAAISLVTAEAVGAGFMLFELRKVVRQISDRESRTAVLSMVGACLATIAVDRVCVPLGVVRPVIDLAVMTGVLTAFGVIKPEWFGLVAAKLLRRPTAAAPVDLAVSPALNYPASLPTGSNAEPPE
jgi:O-antigen/teichoic acid export membrane protein